MSIRFKFAFRKYVERLFVFFGVNQAKRSMHPVFDRKIFGWYWHGVLEVPGTFNFWYWLGQM
jgi:hypothetical protein